MKIPVIVNNRNLLTWPKSMIEKIQTYEDVGEIIIVDNNSTYPPLLEWYNKHPCTVIRLDENAGHTAPWVSRVIERLKSEYYIVTDSDMGLDNTPDNTLLYLKEKLDYLSLDKVGLGLDWRIVKPEAMYYNWMINHERVRWETSKKTQNVAIDVTIDTTFALYKKQEYFIGGGSTMAPYTARHFPWEYSMLDYAKDEEFRYYIDHVSNSCSFKWFLGL